MDNADVLLQSSLSPLTLVAEEASSGIPGASFILYNHVQAFASRKAVSNSAVPLTTTTTNFSNFLSPSPSPLTNTTTATSSYTMATSLLPNYNVGIIFLATSRSPSHHLSIFRKLGITATVYSPPNRDGSGNTKNSSSFASSVVAAEPSVPSSFLPSRTTNQTMVTIIDLHDPYHLPNPSGCLDPEALYLSLTQVCDSTFSLYQSSPWLASSESIKCSLIIEDINPLMIYSSSLQEGQQVLQNLLQFTFPSSVASLSRVPSSSSSSSSSASRFWHTITVRYTTDTDWNISSIPYSMLQAQSLHDWLIRNKAYTLIQLLPLPTGYSRDVHGRLQIIPLQSFTSTSNSGTTSGNSNAVTVPLVAQSLLIRITTDGKVRGIGNIQFIPLEKNKDTNPTKNTNRKKINVGVTNPANEDPEYASNGNYPLPDPDQVEGDYD